MSTSLPARHCQRVAAPIAAGKLHCVSLPASHRATKWACPSKGYQTLMQAHRGGGGARLGQRHLAQQYCRHQSVALQQPHAVLEYANPRLGDPGPWHRERLPQAVQCHAMPCDKMQYHDPCTALQHGTRAPPLTTGITIALGTGFTSTTGLGTTMGFTTFLVGTGLGATMAGHTQVKCCSACALHGFNGKPV